MLIELLLCLEHFRATVKVARHRRLEMRPFMLSQQLS